MSWGNENPFPDGEVESELGYEETGVYTASPNRGAQVKVEVNHEEEEESNDSDVDVVTALLDRDTLKTHKLRHPTPRASVITRVNRESTDGASPTLSRELSFDGRATPNCTPAQSPIRGSVYDLGKPSFLGSPGAATRVLGHPDGPFHTSHSKMDSGNTTPVAPLCSGFLYPANRWNIDLRSRAKSRVADEKLPHPKRKPPTKSPPPNLQPQSGDVHVGVRCGRDDTAASSSSKIHQTIRSTSTETRGRGGSSCSGHAGG